MRIPLDYYRILGLPIQATADQLKQAHRDRALQLPRREFSEAAIAARKQLLDEAFSVLSNPEQRRIYDASFLANPYESELATPEANGNGATIGAIAADPLLDPYAPSIDIQESQLVGALLILLELGEYELVLRLGQPYIVSGNRFSQAEIVRADIILTVAFAYLELGREQWQQGQHENAAVSLEAGQELLLREGIFASVRGEMQSDLYKLRPYRILELLSLPDGSGQDRRQGINLLQDMLHDRGGIDGNGDDQSGLSVDDFLRFIHQLRAYLTASEQQALFEAESRRPSPVATYLAVYALLARGFAYRQPALIRRAKLTLIQLGARQDLHLEQAVCALLLGQTDEATRALEHSQEFESLAFIREHSQDSPDLLPGLCLYSERWLQNEVFPHFRDLIEQQASLKDYFADSQVQSYLEELPTEPQPVETWSSQPSPTYAPSVSRAQAPSDAYRTTHYEQAGGTSDYATGAATATMEPKPFHTPVNGTATVPTAERVSHLSPEGRLVGTAGSGRRPSRPTPPPPRRSGNAFPVPQVDSFSGRSSHGRAPRLDRLLFLIALGVLGLGLLWFLLSWVARSVFGGPTLQGEQLEITLSQPVVSIPTPTPQAEAVDATAPLTDEVARTVVQGWLRAKAASLGSNHDTSLLSQVLAEPILSRQQAKAEDFKAQGVVETYEHRIQSVRVVSASAEPISGATTPTAEADEAQADEAQIEATVIEIRDGVGERVQVLYYVVRQDGRWRIQDIEAQGSEPVEVSASTENPGSADAPGASGSSGSAPGATAAPGGSMGTGTDASPAGESTFDNTTN